MYAVALERVREGIVNPVQGIRLRKGSVIQRVAFG